MMRVTLSRCAALATMLPVLLATGCSNPSGGSGGNGGGSGSGGGSTVTYPDSTGNWVVQATATSGTAPFTQLSGYINEQRVGGTNPSTGTFQPVSTGCYADAQNIPMQGVVQGLRLHLVSFGLDQQVLDISAAKDTTSSHFTGTYSVTGGCADGAKGTVTGTRYPSLSPSGSATFRGPITGTAPQQTLALVLTQYNSGTGEAKFILTGSATLTGSTCFATGVMSQGDGSVLGNQVQMHFVSKQGSTMDIAGDFDVSASTINASSIVLGGTGCPSSNPSQAVLTKG